MATLYSDIVEGPCEVSVRGGVINEVKRTVRVVGIDMSAYGSTEKFLAVPAAAIAVVSVYPIGSSPTGWSNIVLVDVSGSRYGTEPNTVDVDLVYVRRGDPRAQKLYLGAYGVPRNAALFQWRVGTETVQEVTNYDIYGNLMLTQYTYPADDPDFPSQTKQQPADLQINRTLVKLTASGVLAAAYPDVVVAEWTDYVNSDNWYGYPAGVARCVDVEANQRDTSSSPALWDFTFTILIDPRGWLKEARYIDARINTPPPDIVPGVGTVFYEAYRSRPFSWFFPI